ncbi:MAG: Holliday junction branch migration protein RuvA [Anaerolineales bacterium]
MIATIQGKVQSIADDEMVIEVGGIGIRVSVPLARLESVPRIGHEVFLYTHLVVREDALELYGFGEGESRQLFEMLLKVGGVGPKLALATLSHLSVDAIRRSVGSDQAELLTKVPGIGRKTAEKIVLELKDRVGETGMELGAPSEIDSELIEVLTGLGYTLVEAQAAVQSMPDDAAEGLEERVRLALRYFASP